MGLPGTGKRVRVVRQPAVEPVQVPEPVREDQPVEAPEREPVKV